jgi:hypothetical protein
MDPRLAQRFAAWGKLLFFAQMRNEVRSEAPRAAKSPDEGLAKRTLAARDGWSVHDVVCSAGPSDRPFEERHEGFSISAVVEGSFTYRSEVGHELLYPGSLLLGNNGRCFECGHAHGVGDRCVSLNVREELFGEIAAGVAATSRFLFPAPSLAPTAESLPVLPCWKRFARPPPGITAKTWRCVSSRA